MSQQNLSSRQGLELNMISNKAIINAIKKCNPSREKFQEIIESPAKIFNFYEELFTSTSIRRFKKIVYPVNLKKKLIIKAMPSGYTNIFRSRNVFRNSIDPDFKNLDLDVIQKASSETEVKVYELIEDASFLEMFDSIGRELDKLCFTQKQIIYFCKNCFFSKYGKEVFFLFKENKNYYIANVRLTFNGLCVEVLDLYHNYRWDSDESPYLLIPVSN